MAVPPLYEYWAFISYSHHDARVARLLVDRLRRALVPRERRRDIIGASSHFQPVYLDAIEAPAAARLDEGLQQSLRASAKLIVLCSPFAVQSEHVANEIRYFQQIGRASDILCLIVSGVPGATVQGKAALECFPAPLAEVASAAPLAATLGDESEKQWRHAIDQLTAGMLGQALQHRRDWLGRRRRARHLTLFAAAGAVTAICYGLLWAFWLPQYVYAKDGLRRWGIWEPVTPIPVALASQRPQSLRFSRQGAFGSWSEVRWLDGNGRCAAEGPTSIVGDAFDFQCTRSRACGVRLTYASGKLVSEQMFDQYEQTLETLTYPLVNEAILNEAVIGCSRRPGDIESIKLERQTDGPLAGVDRSLQFAGGEHKSPHPNSSHAFGLRNERDEKGRLILRTLLDRQGQPFVGPEGYASMRWRYNSNGDVVEGTTLGLNGKPVDARKGYATINTEVDSSGRWISRRYVDAQGRPVHDERGVHIRRATWSARGQLLKQENLDAQGRPVTDDSGVAAIRYGYVAGDGGRSTDYLDAQGQPTWHAKSGCATIRDRAPLDQLWSEERCFAVDGKPIASRAGWHLKRSQYAEYGQQQTEAYYDVDEKPAMCTDTDDSCPFHRVDNRFDARGNRVDARFYGVNGEPMLNKDGVAGFDLLYNSRNRIRRWINVGLDSKPSRGNDGTVARERVYDAFGREIEILNVDAEGQPLQSRSPVFVIRQEFDVRGNIVRVEYLNQARRPVADESGAAIKTYRYDERGREVTEQPFDAEGRPVTDHHGWYGYQFEYDAWSRNTRATRLGPDGRPQPDPSGVLSRRITFNHRGHRVMLEQLDANENPIAGADGVVTWHEEVDKYGRVLSLRSLGKHGQLVADTDGVAGFDTQYDSRGNQVRYLKIGPDGQPVEPRSDGIAVYVKRYDERNRVVAESFFDAKERPKSSSNGVFGVAYRYDDRGRVILAWNLDANGNLMADRDGVARIETDYDSTGGVAETRFFDPGGKPGSTRFVAVSRQRNDIHGRVIEAEFFDAVGKRTVSPASGRAKFTMERDIFGRLVLERSFDLDGRPVNRRDTGWSYRKLRYGDMGHLDEVQCFDRSARRITPCKQQE